MTNIPFSIYVKSTICLHIGPWWTIEFFGYCEYCCYDYLKYLNICFQLGGICVRIEILDRMVILCLTFWGNAKPTSTMTVPFYTLTNNVSGCRFLYILGNSCYFSFLFSLFFDHSHPSVCCIVCHCDSLICLWLHGCVHFMTIY